MKLKITLLTAILFMAICSYGQEKLKNFDICNSSDTIKKVYKGDTVIIRCNSAYILNQSFINNYSKSLKQNRVCKETVATYSRLSFVQDSIISQQSIRFNALKYKFDSLGVNTRRLLTLTQSELNQLSDSLNNVSRSIIETQNLLIQTQNLLQEEQNTKWKNHFKWGIGGVGVGFLATTLVFIAVR